MAALDKRDGDLARPPIAATVAGAFEKLAEFRLRHGSIHYEVCMLTESSPYPVALAASIFEVHHLLPLSTAATPRRTTLHDLSVVCANCHRAIHATSNVDANMQALKLALAK